MVFRKNLRSLERRWEKISKFLGDLPSEQIFYRNIPLGALVKITISIEELNWFTRMQASTCVCCFRVFYYYFSVFDIHL